MATDYLKFIALSRCNYEGDIAVDAQMTTLVVLTLAALIIPYIVKIKKTAMRPHELM